MLEHNPQTIFIIDNSYSYFTLKECISVAEAVAFPNLILIHSMTKRYAIPGLRVGYITASEAIIKAFRAIRMPWSVNQLAIDAANYILEDKKIHEFDLESFLEEAQRLRSSLLSIEGLDVLPTHTHFMLCKLDRGIASDLKNYLAINHKILIRDASNFCGLDEAFFRIATQTPKENDALVKAIGLWMKEQ